MLAVACTGSSGDTAASPAPGAVRGTRSAAPTATATATARPTNTVTASPSPRAAVTAVPTASATAPPAASPTPRVTASPTPAPAKTPKPTPGGRPGIQDTRATHLTIPAVGIDSPVVRSRAIPDTSPVPAGCPAPPAGQETLTVPSQGIATPEQAFEGLEHKAWIYGHSRWQSAPGVFFVLKDLALGDELFIDGFDRQTGDKVSKQRFRVEGLYLTDKDSGGALVTAGSPAEIPSVPMVILQTSVRESGPNKQWIFDRATVLARATNLVEGNLDDPCKYLLLFVIARAA